MELENLPLPESTPPPLGQLLTATPIDNTISTTSPPSPQPTSSTPTPSPNPSPFSSSPASTTTLTTSNQPSAASTPPLTNNDIKNLQCLQFVISTLITDCIRLTDWNNFDQVARHKVLLFERIKERMREVSTRINLSSSKQSFSQHHSDSDTTTNETEDNREHKLQPQQPHNRYRRSSPESDTQKFHESHKNSSKQQPENFHPQFQKQDLQHRQYHQNSSNEPYSSNCQPTDGIFNGEDSIYTNEYGIQIPKKRKYIYKKPREYKFTYSGYDNNIQTSSILPEQQFSGYSNNIGSAAPSVSVGNNIANIVPHVPHHRGRYPADENAPKSINSFPLSEKLKVLSFFNENYDPVKRNKIELVNRIVSQYNYSYSSIYQLVTNQKTLAVTAHVPLQQGRPIIHNQAQKLNHSYSLYPQNEHRQSNEQPYRPDEAYEEYNHDNQGERQRIHDEQMVPDDNDFFKDESELHFNKTHHSHLSSVVSPSS